MKNKTSLLSLSNVKKYFPIHKGVFYRHAGDVHAVDGITFEVQEGETVGLVGESGCGKSTLGKTLLHLYKPTAGSVSLKNTFSQEEAPDNWPFAEGEMVNLEKLSAKQLRFMRQNMQMIFQDPMEALNSRMPVGTIIEEPLIIHAGEHPFNTPEKRRQEVLRLLKEVGLPESAYYKYPHQFSGGQRQRIGIARAIALKPKLVVCDEPVSALDVSVQSQVLNLMVKLQKELGLTYIFIAHNLSVVKYIADRIYVMYLGRIVETANSEELYHKPLHPYTQALISAIPEPDPNLNKEKQILEGDVPSPINPPNGCHFHPRCPFAQSICHEKDPQLRELEDGHSVACHFAGQLHKRSI